VTPETFAAEYGVSRETLERLEAYVETLAAWTRRINLVAPGSLPEVWRRHVADSAQLAALAPADAETWADLGSGAGLPGLVIAAMRPGLAMTLVESDQRKAAFLRTAAAAMGLAPTVLAQRIEAAPPLAADVISARALAPLPKLIPLACRHAHAGTVCLFPKGARAESELTEAGRDWHSRVEQFESKTDRSGRILRITGMRPRNAVD